MHKISCGLHTVTSLSDQIETWVAQGFPLDHDGTMTGKHDSYNYKSSAEFRTGVHKSLMKRLDTNKTAGPFAWAGDVADLPFPDCAINSIGAVRYEYEQDRARACDDPVINEAITAPTFRMPAIEQLRTGAFPYCSWNKSDISAAFPCMHLRQDDLPWMLFTWYHPDDKLFEGTDRDCLYVHTHGNFGPRPWPHHFTLLMLYVNIAAKTLNLEIPAAFIDDNIHCGLTHDLRNMAPKYHEHLHRAGLSDKPAKRELLEFYGDLLGVYFCSISMMISIPQDKLTRLTGTIQGYLSSHQVSFSELSHLIGYWEFCCIMLPKFMRGFIYATQCFRNSLRHQDKHRRSWLNRRVKRDWAVILELIPLVNNTVPIQPRKGRIRSDPACTDACGGKQPVAAWVTPSGFKFWKITGKKKKHMIALIEGYGVQEYIDDNATLLADTIAPMYIDNTTFLNSLRRGYSRNDQLNKLVQQCLLTCYNHDILLDLYYISSKDNILADAASRQRWDIFYDTFDTFWLFAGSRAAKLKQLRQPDKQDQALQILPPRVRFELEKCREDAYEESTRSNAKSAWTYWERYCEECQCEVWQNPEKKQGIILLAGFKAALKANLYLSNIKASSTVHTYCNQVQWILKAHMEKSMYKAVSRGIDKQLQGGRRFQGSLDLTFFCEMFSKVKLESNSIELKTIRNLLVHTFLGFAVQRSQSAAVSNAANVRKPDRILLRRNVRFDQARNAVWWGLTHSKGDPFGRRKGKDGIDWTVTAGHRSNNHPIDIVWLYQLYCKRMGFTDNRSCQKYRQQSDMAFFQELNKDKPTGRPLSYNSLLIALKQDISLFFPDLDPADFGTHSFRRFGATYMKCKGTPDDLIQYMGRWVSECFQRCFLFSDDDKVNISKQMLE